MKSQTRPQYYRLRRIVEMVREGPARGTGPSSTDFCEELGVSRRTVATYIKERLWHPSQTIRERPDGSVDLALTTTGRQELVRWILSWTPEVRVLAPVDLKQRIIERLQAGVHGQQE